MAPGGQGQGQGHGGGSNRGNKRAKRAAAAAAPSAGRPATFTQKPPGGTHIVGQVPVPVEVTNRPARRN